MSPPPLATPRLDLAPVTRDDIDAVWAIWRHADVRRYLFDDEPVSRERTENVLVPFLTTDTRTVRLWAARLRADGSFVGTVGLRPTPTADPDDPALLGSIEVIVALDPRVWGGGYATEALEAIMAYAFDELALARLVAVVDVPNEASHRMIERLGFTVTGECAGPRYRARTYALAREGFRRRPRGPAAPPPRPS